MSTEPPFGEYARNLECALTAAAAADVCGLLCVYNDDFECITRTEKVVYKRQYLWWSQYQRYNARNLCFAG